MGINIYSGFGLKIRHVSFFNFSNLTINDNDSRGHINFANYKTNIGTQLDVNFALGFKLYLKFLKKRK